MKENPFNDWMNDFEIPRTNEWQNKILHKDSKNLI